MDDTRKALDRIILAGLVRVVAKDGSIWWVLLAAAATFAALASAKVVTA